MYICTVCEHASVVKIGKCPNCGSFGTFVADSTLGLSSKSKSKTAKVGGQNLSQQQSAETVQRTFYPFSQEAYHRVFSNGFKQGGIYLLGGEPGIGKSTLVLQIVESIKQPRWFYFSGEEQVNEIVRRQQRVTKSEITNMSVYHTTLLEDILATLEAEKPDAIIIDSIQTVSTQETDALAGSPNQVKYCADALVTYCRKHNISLILLGHVTKGGEIAGPKYVEHIVDVVLYLEGDRYGQYRLLRCSKNRFGGTDDAVVFRMAEDGLSVVGHDFRITDDQMTHPGRVLGVGLENGRPILVHVEALLTKNYTNHPQRTALGIDSKRLQLIIAILEKYCGCRLFQYDIFVNIPGEFTFYDSGMDLAIAAAMYSQYKNITPNGNEVYIGEIGLSGQIMQPKLYEKRKGILQPPLVCLETIGKNIKVILG